MDTNLIVWAIGFPLLLALLGAGASIGFAMTSSDSIGFLVAKACFALAAFDAVAVSVYWAIATRQQLPWNVTVPAIIAVIAVPTLVLGIQWLGHLEIQLSSRLFPSDIPTAPIPQPAQVPGQPKREVPSDAVQVFWGSNISWFSRYPHTILQMAGEKMIKIDKDPAKKELVITALKIFDDRKNIIARIDADGFWVENSTRKKRPDPSTLVVYDHTDTEVLRLRFLNPNALSITGIFRSPRSPATAIITNEMATLGGLRLSNNIFANSAVDIMVRN